MATSAIAMPRSDLAQLCRAAGFRLNVRRAAVFAILEAAEEPLDAEEIARRAVRARVGASQTLIYRALRGFVHIGAVVELGERNRRRYVAARSYRLIFRSSDGIKHPSQDAAALASRIVNEAVLLGLDTSGRQITVTFGDERVLRSAVTASRGERRTVP